ncbi:hypothetical protein [Prevotella pallens]|nr:hypothetical protein [Prevotella pallens]
MRTNILLVNGFVIILKKLWLSLIYTTLMGYKGRNYSVSNYPFCIKQSTNTLML